MTGMRGHTSCVWVALAALLAAALGGCDNWGFYDQLDGQPVGGELAIDPISATVHTRAQIQFLASGGVPPYVFRLVEGTGEMDAQTGRFTAPAAVGSSVVEVRDNEGAAARAQVITVEDVATE